MANTTKDKEENRKGKYLRIVLSIAIAIGLWAFVTNQENPTVKKTYADIEIEYLNKEIIEEDGLVVAESDTPVTTTVVIQGKRSDLRRIEASDITASVDVSSCEKGDNYADVEIHAPSTVTVASCNPSQVKVTIESLVSSDRDISVEFEGSSPANQEAVCLEIDPETVSVSGASSAVESVKNVRATIQASDVTEEKQTLTASLTPVDQLGNEVPGLTLSADTAEVTVQLYSTKTVPVTVNTEGTADPKYNVTVEAPESVLISCPADELDSVEEIETEPVDISEITETQEVSLTPVLPDYVRLASHQEKIAVVINAEERSNKKIKYDTSDIQLYGLSDEQSVEFSDETFSFTVYGDDGVDDLDESDFTFTLNAENLTETESEMELAVQYSEAAGDLNVWLETPKVKVKLAGSSG